MDAQEILKVCISKVNEYTIKKGIYPNTIFMPRDLYDVVRTDKILLTNCTYCPANETRDLKDKFYGKEVIVTLGNSIKVGYVI